MPALRARVTDQAGLLPPDRVAALESKLARHEAETGNQIAVLTVDTTDGEPIESFALRVAEVWKLGRKGVDDGALLVVAKQDRTARIEVGYGLEGAIPDAIAKRIIEDMMVPRFRAGDFAGGLDAATDAILRAAGGEALPAPPPSHGSRGRGSVDPIPFLFFVSILSTMIGAPFRRRLRPLGALIGGVFAGGVAWVVLKVGLWSALAFAIGAALGWIGPTSGMAAARRGGFGGGFGGGGFGGGGFSGGGGGFGGGGASGRW